MLSLPLLSSTGLPQHKLSPTVAVRLRVQSRFGVLGAVFRRGRENHYPANIHPHPGMFCVIFCGPYMCVLRVSRLLSSNVLCLFRVLRVMCMFFGCVYAPSRDSEAVVVRPTCNSYKYHSLFALACARVHVCVRVSVACGNNRSGEALLRLGLRLRYSEPR